MPTGTEIVPQELPGGLSWRNAPLPELYEAAINAIAACERVDECKEWVDKSSAIESYARQVRDERFFNFARRIRARSYRRLGEMLNEYDGRGKSAGAGTSFVSRKRAAQEAGVSRRQSITASRIVHIPREKFDALVESDDPQSITRLAEFGTRKRESTPVQTGEDLYAASKERATEALYKSLYALSHEQMDCADIAEVIKRIANERNPDGMKEHRYKRLAPSVREVGAAMAAMGFTSRDN